MTPSAQHGPPAGDKRSGDIPCAEASEHLDELAAGLLEGLTHEGVTRHVSECAVCAMALDSARVALEPLLRERDSQKRQAFDHDALWQRIDAAIDADLESARQQIAEVFGMTPSVSSRIDGPWIPTGVPGVRVKVLEENRSEDRRMVLIEMDAGCVYPAHAHHGTEECLVVAGDIGTDEVVLTRGDFQRLSAGTLHAVQRTKDGCLVVIVGSYLDGAA